MSHNQPAHHPKTTRPKFGAGFNLSRWALEHPALTRYLMVVLLALGALSYFQLGQDEDPPFTFRAMALRTFWPGATATQMAQQVTQKLERTLQEVPHADIIQSYSKPGESLILLQLADSTPATQVEQLWYTTRKKVGDMQASLPQGVQGPYFVDEFGDVYGVIYALSGQGYSHADLKDVADDLRQQLLRVPDVAKVEIYGNQAERIFIEVSQLKLAQLGLNMEQILAQLGQQNAVANAGVVHGPQDSVALRVDGQFNALQDLRAMPIMGASGQQLRLGDIAEIRRGYEDPPSIKVRHDGQEVLALGISMARGGDIVALGKALRTEAARLEKTLPAGMQLRNVQDQPQAVTSAVNEFIKVLLEAVIIVLAVSFISLGLHRRTTAAGEKLPLWRRWTVDIRPGLVVGITIPLVLCITFIAMLYWGIGLHKISLGSLIIALGLLVDDAIIAVEMMVRKMEEGYDKLRAATFAYEITAKPMLTGTLITAAGFLPIGLAKSVTGEYTFAIFAVTGISLLISWIVSVYFVPYLGLLMLKHPAHVKLRSADNDSNGQGANAQETQAAHAAQQEHAAHEVFDSPFYNRFRRTVHWCITHRWLTISATLLIFALGMAGMGKVQKQFFPDSNRPEVLVDVWLPEGSSFAATEAVAQRMERDFLRMDGVSGVTAWVGSGLPRFYLPLDQIFPQTNVAQFILQPASQQERDKLLRELPQYLAQHVPEARTRAKLLPQGPPVAYPVQFRIIGPDPQVLRQRADEARAIMQAHPHMRGVNDNWNEYIKVLQLHVDQDKARALGVSSQHIAQAAQTVFNGQPVGQYREGDKLIQITLRTPEAERNAITDLASAYVTTSGGRSIPLAQIATARIAWEPGVMWRHQSEFAVTVQGDVIAGVQGATATASLLPQLRELERQWQQSAVPGNYRIVVAGESEESAKGSASIMAGVPLMLFAVFTLLVIQLNSFSRAMLVFLTGPLGIAGAAAALLALNRPMGFVAMLGIIALMGMIQRNSVILIDQIETDRAQGIPAWTAIVEAAVRRLRPIALTAAAAVLAMIPLSRSTFWGPMAVAIMGGLIIATVLTLLALPAMYAAWFRVKPPQEEQTSA